MAAEITSVTPGRVRTGDALSILGTGFSATPGQNTVTVDGQAAVVGVDSATQVDVTVPAGVTAGPPHVKVVLTNLDDGTSSTWWVWIKPAAASLASSVLPFKEPFRDEVKLGPLNTAEDPRLILAKSLERWAAAIELIPKDLLANKGSLVSGGAAGLVAALPGALGEFLSSFSGGARFQPRQVTTLHWGRLLLAANDSPTLMEAGGTDAASAVAATEEVCPKAGVIFMFSAFGSNGSFANRVDLLELLVNGAVVETYDLTVDPGIGLGPNSVVTFYPSVEVSAGDRVQVRATKTGATAAAGLRAMAQVV